jgi:hypothetical protein
MNVIFLLAVHNNKSIFFFTKKIDERQKLTRIVEEVVRLNSKKNCKKIQAHLIANFQSNPVS